MTIPVLVVDQAGTMNGAEPVSLTNPLPVLNITSASNSSLNANSAALVSSLIAKAASGNLYGMSGYNSKSTEQFIQIHDSAVLPGDASIPKIVFRVPASSNFTLDFGAYGRSFSNGIVFCNSSTAPTKTIGSADCWFDAQYK